MSYTMQLNTEMELKFTKTSLCKLNKQSNSSIQSWKQTRRLIEFLLYIIKAFTFSSDKKGKCDSQLRKYIGEILIID